MRLSFSNGGFQTSTLMFIGTEGVLRRPLTYDSHPFMTERQKGEKRERRNDRKRKRGNDKKTE